MHAAFWRLDQVHAEATVDDSVFAASVNFIHRRYVYGQTVVACAVKEEVWHGVDADFPDKQQDIVQLAVRVLRLHAGSTITLKSVLRCDLQSKRVCDTGTDEAKDECLAHLRHMLQVICDLGLGAPILHQETLHICGVRKFAQQHLSDTARDWLHRNRVSLMLFGVADHTRSADAAGATSTLTARSGSPGDAGTRSDNVLTDSRASNNNISKRRTLQRRTEKEEATVFTGIITERFATPFEFRNYLATRQEFSIYRVTLHKPTSFYSGYRCMATCREDAGCDVEWQAVYETTAKRCQTTANFADHAIWHAQPL